MSLEDLARQLRERVETLVDFDGVMKHAKGESKCSECGLLHHPIRFKFTLAEREILFKRWEQLINNIKLFMRDTCREGEEAPDLSQRYVYRVLWRKYPEILERPDYPGEYLLSARLTIRPIKEER